MQVAGCDACFGSKISRVRSPGTLLCLTTLTGVRCNGYTSRLGREIEVQFLHTRLSEGITFTEKSNVYTDIIVRLYCFEFGR